MAFENYGYSQPRITFQPDRMAYGNDPLTGEVENIIRSGINTFQTPLAGQMQNILGQLQPAGSSSSSSSGGGGGYSPNWLNADPLSGFRDFVKNFNPTQGSQALNQYAGSRDASAPVNFLTNFAQSQNPQQFSQELRDYAQTFNPSSAVQPLQQYLQGFDPMAGFQQFFDQRIQQLQASPFDDTELAARRAGSFDEMERDRGLMKQRVMEQMAAAGHDPTSGVVQAALQQVDQQFGQQRAQKQNMLTQEEFNMRRENLNRADDLQLARQQMTLQAAQMTTNIMGQIASLQQQGMGMEQSLRTSLAQMGLTEQGQQQQVMTNIASLMQQGLQMQDALQIALSNTMVQEQGIRANLQGQLAGAEANVFGSRLGLEGALAQAAATRSAASSSNRLGMMNLARQLALDERSGAMDAINAGLTLQNLGGNPMDFMRFFGG